MSNKVNFGLKNAHYSKVTIENDGSITYATPKPLPGSTEISLEPRGDMTEFYADDVLYYSADNNQGYDGTLTLASLTDDFLTEILGEELDTDDGVITEKSNAKGSYFALLFEFDGDKKATRHALYYCKASRPSVGSATKTDSVEPNTTELSFVSSPRPTDYKVKAKSSANVTDAAYNNWYTSVYDKATTPLTVTVSPLDEATGVLITENIVWIFDKAIIDADVNSNNFYLIDSSTGTEVTGALTLDATKKIVTFDSISDLSAATSYIATATTAIKATDSSTLASKSIVNFTTA